MLTIDVLSADVLIITALALILTLAVPVLWVLLPSLQRDLKAVPVRVSNPVRRHPRGQ